MVLLRGCISFRLTLRSCCYGHIHAGASIFRRIVFRYNTRQPCSFPPQRQILIGLILKMTNVAVATRAPSTTSALAPLTSKPALGPTCSFMSDATIRLSKSQGSNLHHVLEVSKVRDKVRELPMVSSAISCAFLLACSRQVLGVPLQSERAS